MMKKKLLLTTALIAIVFPLCMHAQDNTIQFGTVGDGNRKEFNLTAKTYSLFIAGIPSDRKLEVFEDGNVSFAGKGGTAANGGSTYKLDDIVKDMKKGDKKKFVIRNKGANKALDSFFLVSQIATGPSEPRVTTPKPPPKPEDPITVAIAFYDAMAIYRDYEGFLKGGDFTQSVFDHYNFAARDGESTEAIILTNPFFKKFHELSGAGKKVKVTEADRVGGQSGGAGILAALSGIDVTKYVQAAADFLRDRIKQELTLAFIDRFRNVIESIPELGALLPKTYNVFTTSDIFKTPSLGQTYKTAFKEDLEKLVDNFERFVDTDERYKDLRTNQVFIAFRIAYHTIDMSANDFHPIDIFDNLDARFGFDNTSGRIADINKYVSLLNHLSQHLRKRSTPTEVDNQENVQLNGWVTIRDLREFNPKAMLLFWGLLYQQRPVIFDEIKINATSLKEVLLKGTEFIQASINTAQLYLNEFITLANNIDERIKEFKRLVAAIKDDAEQLKDKAVEDFITNADKLIEVTDFIFRLPFIKNGGDAEFFKSDYFRQWRPVVLHVIETTKGIYAKDYSKISVNATQLVTYFINWVKGQDSAQKFLENFTFYSNFMVDVINADEADDVKAVLERYAEPVGSYRVKRKSAFSVSLNAYPGIYFGVETYKGTSNKAFGVTAPIGLSFNWGSWGKNKDWSFSIFVNAVDIAAALSYRWTNDSLDLPEKITLGQIFAPGGYAVLGFPKVPISMKLGAQYVPKLRTITKDGNTLGDVGVWRFGLSATVDIPVFNFYNRSGRGK